MRSASSPTRAPPTRVTTTFSRPSCPSRAAKPSRPRSESSGSKVSRNGATPSTRSSLAGRAARLSGALRTSRTTSRAKAYSWPATSNDTSICRSSALSAVVSRTSRPLCARRGRARSSWTKAAPISAAISRILTMDFLPSVAKAPLRSSPGLAANSAWRVSICSASTVTSASTTSTASATGAAPSRTIARVAASVVASPPSRP